MQILSSPLRRHLTGIAGGISGPWKELEMFHHIWKMNGKNPSNQSLISSKIFHIWKRGLYDLARRRGSCRASKSESNGASMKWQFCRSPGMDRLQFTRFIPQTEWFAVREPGLRQFHPYTPKHTRNVCSGVLWHSPHKTTWFAANRVISGKSTFPFENAEEARS